MHTHNPTLAPNQLPAKQDQLQWEIAIDGSLFRTIKAISTAQSEIMCGRAPLVWLAVCVNDDIAAEEVRLVYLINLLPNTDGSIGETGCDQTKLASVWGAFQERAQLV